MNCAACWKVCVRVAPEAEEGVAALLEAQFGQAPVTYAPAEGNGVAVSVFVPAPVGLPSDWRRKLRTGLQQLRQAGVRLGLGRVSLTRIRARDWAESWKTHFRPIEIQGRLLIKPSWSHRPPRRHQRVVVLDPGLSFGTGHHPTTAFCLEQLVACRRPDRNQALLDVGTGSGILAIAGAKLGYAPVHAFDCDPEALRVARANARRNRVAHRVRITVRDITKLALDGRGAYDVICANLNANLIMAACRPLLARLRPGGTLVLAGILRKEFPVVGRIFRRAGLRLVASQTRGEWRSGGFRSEAKGAVHAPPPTEQFPRANGQAG